MSDKLHMEKIRLRAFVDDLIIDFRPLIEEAKITLINGIPPETRLFADPKLLHSIFQTFISNAIQHTHNGEISIGAKEYIGFVDCWIKDNGTGIHEDEAGLGLAIVKRFVEAHRGTISVESKFGAGSTVRFTISCNNGDGRI